MCFLPGALHRIPYSDNFPLTHSNMREGTMGSKNKKVKAKASFSAFIALINWATMTPLHGEGSLLSGPHAFNQSVIEGPKVIYGVDNRFESELYPNRDFREKAKSVAGMVHRNKIVPNFRDSESHVFFKKSAKRSYDLCPDERFALQNVLPICSGFLAAPDILVTAGHCIETVADCKDYVWIFDYVEGTDTISNDNIYGCKEIIANKLDSSYFSLKDYAIIRLDKPVKNREPLKVRMKGRPNWGEPLVIIGHPLGLPQKVSDGAQVKIGNALGFLRPIKNLIRKRDFFMANLDAFGGNSGSPVFNEETGLVEGILVEGAEDFKEDQEQMCNRSIVKKDSGFVTDEKVFRINKMKPLKKLLQAAE